MEIWSAIGAFLGLAALVLKYFFKQKTKTDRAKDLARYTQERVDKIKRHIVKGETTDLEEEMDQISANMRVLRGLWAKKNRTSE